ncbi:conserved hypothetical protein [Methylocella tundrae]|jgi:hypothetical protein|uniref:Uncharacterized protein n=1 Tax=Methylocella tundrae TaxID=227605 RepID=A0A8B6M534_METTU|nr:hypothetical protein [Methylocella tundrae]VTZ26846.1 conserved hypothetical protein [Methylocella tundrae]VTZ49469.1 conserved hypothetical protein [Methylocella tundrae]
MAYEPPKQSTAGQIFDALLMMALVIVTLYAPLLLKLAGGGTTTQELDASSWRTLGQNAVMSQQWEKLGFTPATAAPIIAVRFDYVINWGTLALSFAVIIAYFVVLIKISDRQYKDVIAEHFGPAQKINKI